MDKTKTYSTRDFIIARLKEITKLKTILQESLNVYKHELKLFQNVFVSQTGDDVKIQQILDDIERVEVTLAELYEEERDLGEMIKLLKQGESSGPEGFGLS